MKISNWKSLEEARLFAASKSVLHQEFEQEISITVTNQARPVRLTRFEKIKKERG